MYIATNASSHLNVENSHTYKSRNENQIFQVLRTATSLIMKTRESYSLFWKCVYYTKLDFLSVRKNHIQ